jgi:hypothetical protein
MVCASLPKPPPKTLQHQQDHEMEHNTIVIPSPQITTTAEYSEIP